jgi:HTH-type transcriptional regulator, glycine betaine synthesis regulator
MLKSKSDVAKKTLQQEQGDTLPQLAAGPERFERELVAFFVETANALGIPRSVASIYGTVFASAAPLGFREIEERLDFSKGSISQGVRVLREMGALRTIAVPGGRREFFVPEESLRELVGQYLENRLRGQLIMASKRLAVIARLVPSDATEAQVLRRRLKYLRGWSSKARALLPVAKTFLNLGK